MKNCFIVSVGLLVFAAFPELAAPISFPTVSGSGHRHDRLRAFDHGHRHGVQRGGFQPSFNGGFSMLIGVLNLAPGVLHRVPFTVAQRVGNFAFSQHGACLGTGSPLVSVYSPGPTAAKCLNGQYWTTDAMDYAADGVTFRSFDLATACMLVGHADGLPSGGSAWFSLPCAITASQITSPTPELASLVLTAQGRGTVLNRIPL